VLAAAQRRVWGVVAQVATPTAKADVLWYRGGLARASFGRPAYTISQIAARAAVWRHDRAAATFDIDQIAR